jgi:hypothetical protein
MPMKNLRQKLLILSLFLGLTPLFGQSHSKGAILDPVSYSRIEVMPTLVTRSYTSIPPAVSLKQYCPIPEDQGPYGTCVGWSTAFAARTISESIALARTDRTTTSNSVFSPTHVYKNISDNEGQNGASISMALEFMRNTGIVKRPLLEKTMYTANNFRGISLSIFNNSRTYPISSYVTLFVNPMGVPGAVSERIPPIKKCLAEGRPVIIGMNCPDSFFIARGIWQPTESPYESHGGHAMCVVGYDDTMYGGAFEIQNSWGADWGNEGYIWISYRDFALFVAEAYAVVENLAIYKDAARYAGSIKIEVFNSAAGMPVTYDRQGFYKTTSSYPSRTDFRYLMTNRYPAYVYAFAGDSSTQDTDRIFPMKGISPILDYTDSTIAWPGEYDWIRLNDVVGTDYLVVLYSKGALDIDAIQRRFAGERGTFPERVARAVGSNFIPYGEVQYSSGTMEFSAVSTNPNAVFGLLLAIDHRAR